MITYRRTGGFAGEETTLEITEDGKFTFRRSLSGRPLFDVEMKLESSRLEKLTCLLEQVDLFSLKDEYKAETPVIDGYSHILTVSKGDLTKTITATTGGNVPSGFQTIVAQLEEIMKQALQQ